MTDGTTPSAPDVQTQINEVKKQIAELADSTTKRFEAASSAIHELQKEFANDPADTNGGKKMADDETTKALDAVEDEVVSASARRIQEYDANAKLRYDTVQEQAQQITQNAINAANQILNDSIARSEAMDNAVVFATLKAVENLFGCHGEVPPKKSSTTGGSTPTA